MLTDFRLSVFEAVYRLGNFTRAGEELGITQSAVSQNIAELERELGAALFVRSRSGVTPTEQGERFLPCVKEILHWYEMANSYMSAGPSLATVRLQDGKTAEVWGSSQDIHIKIK